MSAIHNSMSRKVLRNSRRTTQMLQAYMETQTSTDMRVVLWENGTVYGEPVDSPNPRNLLQRASTALSKDRHRTTHIKYCQDAAVVSHDHIAVAVPCVTEKVTGTEDLQIIRYSRTILQSDRNCQKVIFEGVAALRDL